MDYLPLGDSYTIGTNVGERDRWPDQLVALLAERGAAVRLVANPAVNGYSTAEVIRDELPVLERSRPGLVSLLIGVNDAIRHPDERRYRANVAGILDRMVAVAGAGRAWSVATPDYTLTPAGADYGDPVEVRARIARFNDVLREESDRRAIPFVDITPVANQVPDDPRLVAGDGLHPSGRQYLAWAELMLPVVAELLTPR